MSVDDEEYFDRAKNKKGVLAGCASVLATPSRSGDFHVWSKGTANNSDLASLSLHGGPGATHEYFIGADPYVFLAGVQYYCLD